LTEKTERPTRKKLSLFSSTIKLLRSVKFAITIMILIACACIVGTLIKQEPFEPHQVMDKYGRTIASLVGLFRLNEIYSTGWFLALLAAFALSSTVCAFSRRRFTIRMMGSFCAHASIILIVTGVIVRAVFGVDGIIRIGEGEVLNTFYNRQNTAEVLPLGFRLRLDEFNLHYYENTPDFLVVGVDDGEPQKFPVELDKPITISADGTTITALRTIPHFLINEKNEIYSASENLINPAVEVIIKGPFGESHTWLFSKMPDFTGHAHNWPENIRAQYHVDPPAIKAFESKVSVLDEADSVIQTGDVLVNSPLKIGRYKLYQVSYDAERLKWSQFDVTYDPGWIFVLLGFIIMPAGIAFTFYVKPFLKRKGVKNV